MHKNTVAITVTLLQRYIPEKPDTLSFADLQQQIMANTKKLGGDPFWMTVTEKEHRYCVLVTALECVGKVRSPAMRAWIIRALKAYPNEFGELEGILEECPDKSILPLIANWEKMKEVADASTTD